MATTSRTSTISPENRSGSGFISIRGARLHNLRGIDVQIPRGKLVVVTGPSGSGKSSLAIGTVFAEGQRQYIETLSTWARQFTGNLPRPEVDSIEGLQPTLCIDQHPSSSSPRSTVGTVTGVHDFLRLLMARAADIHCHQCGAPIRQMSPERIVSAIESLPEGTRAMILAPIVRGRRGRHADALEAIRKAGLLRARVNGQVVELDALGELDARKSHSIEAVTDRIVVRPGGGARLAESVALALRLGDGTCMASWLETGDAGESWREQLFSTRFACPQCEVAYAPLEPKTFSFNSPYGACPACEGLGWTWQFDPDLVIDTADPVASLASGAVVAWRDLPAAARRKRLEELAPFLAGRSIDANTPLASYTAVQRRELLYGGSDAKKWTGLLTLLEKEWSTTLSERRQELLESFRALVACPACDASRLGPQARAASVNGQTIIDINRAPLVNLLEFFRGLKLDESRRDVGEPLVAEIARRLEFLCETGLGYLTLDRPADTLSGGEYQRVRLATAIGSGLARVCYVLDEPTVGLHPADNRRLIEAIRKLQRNGNSVIVVEHDADMMRAADWIIDMGPGAGRFGGEIVFAGPTDDILQHETSVTGQFLAGRRRIQARESGPRPPDDRHFVEVTGATGHNLQGVEVRIPLGLFVAVSGVSGSGKSTLVQDTLAPALAARLGRAAPRPLPHRALNISGALDSLVPVNQRPIGRSSRSNTATYSGIMQELRKLFAATREAKARGYGPGRFSFNSGSGRCETCQGLGQQRIEMTFLPDLVAPCPQCQGRRFNQATLEVRWRGHSIADVLAMPIGEARDFFQNVESMHRTLTALDDVGLGYLPLGQPSTTLSGGEAQRVRLATELGRNAPGHTLYLLDEPTTGLHFEDVDRLLRVLHRLVTNGNTVLVIEHHPDVIASSDWVVQLGPGSGEEGGHLVSAGPPPADDR